MFLRDYQPEWDVKFLILGYFLIAQSCPTAFRASGPATLAFSIGAESGQRVDSSTIDLKKSKIDLRSVLEYVTSIPEQIWTHWWFSCFETSANCGVAFYAFYAYQSREKVFRVAISVSYMALLFRKWDGSTVVIDGTFSITVSTWWWNILIRCI